MKAAERNRGAKKVDLIVIDDDDSASAPASAKVEGGMQSGGGPDPVPLPPPPSPELIELREKNAKLERMFQRACRATREAEMRAEQAESLLDSKRGLLESAEKLLDGGVKEKLNGMTEELEEAKRRVERAETAASHAFELTRERDALKEELEHIKRNTLSMRERSLELAEKVTYLTQQLEHEREVAKELLEDYREKIAELSEQLAESKLSEIAPSGQTEKIVRKEERTEPERPVRKVRNQLDVAIAHLAPPPEKIARMEEMYRTELDAAKKVLQPLLQPPQPLLQSPQPLLQLQQLHPLLQLIDTVTAAPKATAPRETSPPLKLDKNGSQPESGEAAGKRPHEEPKIELTLSLEALQQLQAIAADRERQKQEQVDQKSGLENEMRGRMRGEVGERMLGLLLGRKKPSWRGEEHVSSSSVNKLLGMARDMRAGDGTRLNEIMNFERFTCICGANIQSGIALIGHFNAPKHINKRSHPVYQSDVDYWIDAIKKIWDRPEPERDMNGRWKNDMYDKMYADRPKKMLTTEDIRNRWQEAETPKTLQYAVDGGEWRSISDSKALEEYNNYNICTTTLFRRGDKGFPRTLATLMKMNGEENPFTDFPEPSFPRKRPHEEKEIESGQSDEGGRSALLKWAEFEKEMRRRISNEAGAPGYRVLGLLLGRETPAREGDEKASVSSVQKLMGMARDLKKTAASKLNSVANLPRFKCMCGAMIQSGVMMLHHFDRRKHVEMRSEPVYQSDVDYWIDIINGVNEWHKTLLERMDNR